jgi:hypothetical protein
VNWSAFDVLEVPLNAVTVMCTVAAASGGAVTVIDVSETTVKLVAGTVPNDTPDAPVKWVPVKVTRAPPAVKPAAGAMPVTAGTVALDTVK